MKQRKIIPFLSLLCLICVLLFSSNLFLHSKFHYRYTLQKQTLNTSNFSDFCQSFLPYEITSDSITQAYSITKPETYKIPDLPASFPDVIPSTSTKSTDAIIKKLHRINTTSLSDSDETSHQLLNKSLQLSKNLNQYSYYENLLGATSGIPANLPITLGEYPLNSEADVVTYLSLLKQLPHYFKTIKQYDTARQKQKLTTPTFCYIATIQNLSPIIESLETDHNAFLQTFEERLSNITTIPSKKKQKYIEKNSDYVHKYIAKAYKDMNQYLIQQLPAHLQNSNLTADNIHPADYIKPNTSYGLASLPKGKEYYSLLVSKNTGSNKSVPSLITLTDTILQNTLAEIISIAIRNPDIYQQYCNTPPASKLTNPNSILESLSLSIRSEFPLLKASSNYTTKEVPSSLTKCSSPAFFMIPPIDYRGANTIYVNTSQTNTSKGNLYPTLAHEGFPGHLYQTQFFRQTNPNVLRYTLNYPGYVEGWAIYAELYAYQYMIENQNEDLIKLCQLYEIVSLSLSSRTDLGVNYEGWTIEDANSYFENHGFQSYYCKDLYAYVTENPGNYLSYFIGYEEILELKEQYQKKVEDSYNEKSFHQRVLEAGPCDFTTLRNIILH